MIHESPWRVPMPEALPDSRSYAELLEHLSPEGLRPLSRADYDRMVALGLFDDERVELLHGVLVRMSPQGPLHSEVIDRLTERLVPVLLGRARVRIQGPLAASDDSEPEPDVAVLPPGDYSQEHPARALLVIEVSETSLTKDRHVKAGLYAASGIPEYWIVNLPERVIEVHSRAEEGAYRRTETRRPGDEIAPVEFPDVRIRVDEILP
jgi:Uma2 family endonuclease